MHVGLADNHNLYLQKLVSLWLHFKHTLQLVRSCWGASSEQNESIRLTLKRDFPKGFSQAIYIMSNGNMVNNCGQIINNSKKKQAGS